MTQKIYNVFRDGVLIKEGTANEIALFFNCEPRDIYRKTKGERVDLIGECQIVGTKKVKNAPVNVTKEDLLIDYNSYEEVLNRLKRYGNTICSKDPEGYLEGFKKEGLNVKVYLRGVNGSKISHIYKKKDKHYLIEVVDGL